MLEKIVRDVRIETFTRCFILDVSLGGRRQLSLTPLHVDGTSRRLRLVVKDRIDNNIGTLHYSRFMQWKGKVRDPWEHPRMHHVDST